MPISTTTTLRRFEFVGGAAAKFWEVQCQGNELHLRFGRLGTDGQRQTKTLPDAGAAQQQMAKLIRAKLAKGYVAAM